MWILNYNTVGDLLPVLQQLQGKFKSSIATLLQVSLFLWSAIIFQCYSAWFF